MSCSISAPKESMVVETRRAGWPQFVSISLMVGYVQAESQTTRTSSPGVSSVPLTESEADCIDLVDTLVGMLTL